MAKKATSKKKEKYITTRHQKTGDSYEICIRMNDQTFRKSVRISDFETSRQALDFAVQLRDETLQKMRTGYTVSGFKTVSEIWKKSYDLYPVRLKTKERHQAFYNLGIAEYGDTPIDKITSADIQTSVNKYARTHTEEQTSHFLAVWRRIYKTCAMMDINVIDRTVPVTIPECAQGNPRAKEISKEDLERFCKALWNYNAASVSGSYRAHSVFFGIQIMLYCGLRPQEVFALHKSDINLIQGYINIDKSSHSTYDSYLDIGKAKTDYSVRHVPIPDPLRPILIECMNWSKHDILLADYYGNLQDIDDIDTLIRNVRNKKDVDVNFTLYMLRHQFSTDMLNSYIPLNVLRDLMGHASGTMSLDYAVSKEEDRILAMKKRIFS